MTSAAMLGDTDEANRRKPFEFLSSIFKRRREHDENESDVKPSDIHFEESNFYSQSWVSDQDHGLPLNASLSPRPIQPSPLNHLTSSSIGHISSITSTPSPIRSSIMIATATIGIPLSTHPGSLVVTSSPSHGSYLNGLSTPPPSILSSCSSPILIHQTPIKTRDIGEDMEAIRLSRQDNPYLQKVGGSRTSLVDDESPENCPEVEEEDTVHLVSHHHHHSHRRGLSEDSIISLSEVHEHLIRSPPPTSVPKILAERGIFIFPTDLAMNVNTVHPGTGKPHVLNPLNPLITKSHEDVLDQNLRQILDTQRKLSAPKVEICSLSTSVPGSPARMPNQTLPLQLRKSSHSRTHSEEVPTLQYTCSTTGVNISEVTVLGPVVIPGKKHPSTSEVLLTRPLLNNVPAPSACFSPPLKPLNRNNQSRRGSSILRGSSVPSSNTGSSSSLTLPIKCPHQPAITKIT